MNKKIFLLFALIMSNFVQASEGFCTDGSTSNLVFKDNTATAQSGCGFNLAGDGHVVERCTAMANSVGVLVSADQTIVRNSNAQNNTGDGFCFMPGVRAELRASSAANNTGFGINDMTGGGLTEYDDIAHDNLVDDFGGDAKPSDFLTEFSDTFTELAVIKAKVCDIQEDQDGTFTVLIDIDADIAAVQVKVCDIQATVNSLNLQLTTTGACCECEIFITQDDIPFTISSPGIYCLAEAITGSGSSSITISSDDVVLDLRDYVIDGGTTGVVISNVQRVQVRNGTIINTSGDAVDVDGSTNLFFENIKIDSPGSNGFDLATTNTVEFTACHVTNATSHGYLLDASNVILRQCTAYQNTGRGFQAAGLSNVDFQFIDCSAILNTQQGFIFLINSNLEVINCIANENTSNGFDSSASNGRFNNCIANKNTSSGFSLFAEGDRSVFYNCMANENDGSGYNFSSGPSDVEVRECSAHGNGLWGINGNATPAPLVFSCVAFSNSSGDYNNIVGGPTVAAGSVVSGTGYWVNIST